MVNLHGIDPATVVVTGSQVFDDWFDRRPSTSRESFCSKVGVPADRPMVLYVCSALLEGSPVESAFVLRWVKHLRQSTHPVLRDCAILIRPHFKRGDEWQAIDFSGLGEVVCWPRAGDVPVDARSKTDYFDSLFHATAVVGLNTSAMIEAAIVGRPVFSILAAEFAGTQEGTVHFQHLLPEHGGFVRLAPTLHDHIAQLTAWRHDPAAAERDAERFIASFIRPHGVDRPATPLFADVIERLGALPAPRPRRAPAWTLALRPLLLAAAVPVPVVAALRRPGAADRARRQVDRLVYTGHKRASRTVRLARDRAQRILRKAGKRWRRALSNQRARVR
jgi:hypothetical protein